jgi:pyruvate/2-oxoglutarate dehydrogenase complex dihydrolipoamide dehydrogenase (E3) component
VIARIAQNCHGAADLASPETGDAARHRHRKIVTMTSSGATSLDVVVIGAGPAGVVAALRAARLGARTALVTRDEFGGMAANDGPVPVRTLAHAARLMREAGQLPRYGITIGEPKLEYRRLLDRVREVTGDVRTHSLLREELQQSGVTIHEHAGAARFTGPHVIECEHAPQLHAAKSILCTGGISRRLDLPGFELACTHSDAWTLSSAPLSMLVIGAGATGVQLASIFNAFGSQVTLFEAAPRILMSEDEDVAAAVSQALSRSGIQVLQNAGKIDRLEPSPAGVRLAYERDSTAHQIDATIAVLAVGWVANTAGLNLAAAGVETDPRGYVRVDAQLRTTAPHIFAAGDATGHVMVVHEAVREAYLAATNAVLGTTTALGAEVSPLGSFTDPEYASVGLTETTARQTRDVIVATQRFESLPRPIIDGRPTGFCKLIADRQLHTILGCHIVGERAVELAQLAAIAMAADMRVEQLALVPFSFPTYANALGRAAIEAARELDLHAASAGDRLSFGAG